MPLSDQRSALIPGLSTDHPAGDVLVAQRAPEARQWAIYLHERGKRPRLVEVQVPDKFPGSLIVGEKTYFWVGADISRRTLTYSDVKGGVS